MLYKFILKNLSEIIDKLEKLFLSKGYKYFYYMIYTEEDKKLVDQYKQTNITLRKQLNALN